MSHYSLAQKPAELSKLIKSLGQYKSMENLLTNELRKINIKPLNRNNPFRFGLMTTEGK